MLQRFNRALQQQAMIPVISKQLKGLIISYQPAANMKGQMMQKKQLVVATNVTCPQDPVEKMVNAQIWKPVKIKAVAHPKEFAMAANMKMAMMKKQVAARNLDNSRLNKCDMKKLLLILMVIFLAVQSHAQFSRATLQATGLTCAMCSNAINKALQKLTFIQSVRSDIKNSSFNIVFTEKADVDIDEIRKAVEDAGFAIGSLKLTGNFNEVKIENDKHVQIGDKHFHFLNVDNRVLNGEQTITIVDKDFLTAKQFKKFSAATKMSCLQSGKAGSGCTGVAAGTRMYHVTI
jgi:copper chaperone CopZ